MIGRAYFSFYRNHHFDIMEKSFQSNQRQLLLQYFLFCRVLISTMLASYVSVGMIWHLTKSFGSFDEQEKRTLQD